jgi:hypothetical protein
VCRACQRAFPHRPTINVGMPWAVAPKAPIAYGPLASSGSPASGSVPHPHPEATGGLAASVAALAETQRLITKVSRRSLPPHYLQGSLASSNGVGRRGARDPRQSFERGPVTATRVRPAPQLIRDSSPAAEGALLQVAYHREEADDPSLRAHWAPLVFLSLLALIAAVALLFLVRSAGDSGAGLARENPAPHQPLSISTEPGEAASAELSTDNAPAIGTTENVWPTLNHTDGVAR